MMKLAAAIFASAVLLAACSGGQDAPAPESLAVEQMRAERALQVAGEKSAAATEDAQREIDRLALQDEQNRIALTQQAIVETAQAQAQEWIEITRVAEEMRLEAERAAITNTIAINEAVADAELRQAEEQKRSEEQLKIDLEAARAEADMRYWSGLAWNAAIGFGGICIVIIVSLLLHFVWVWYRSSLDSVAKDTAYRDSQRGLMLPNGSVVYRPPDPYDTLMIDTEGVSKPTWQVLGWAPPPAPQLEPPAPDGDTVPVNTARGSHDIKKQKGPSPEVEDLLTFLNNCRTQVGGRSPRLPSAKDYAERWGTSRTTWQNHVNALTPQWLAARGTDGTFMASPRYKHIDALIEGVMRSEIRPAAKPRKATVPPESVSVLTPSASD